MKNNLIAGFGGFLCIAVLSYLNSLDETNLWLIPPFGASMVLVMAVNESPLAHPKNVFFGHLISAFAGVLVFWIFGYSAISLGLGVGLAIFLMIRRPPRSTRVRSSAASDVYKRQILQGWELIHIPKEQQRVDQKRQLSLRNNFILPRQKNK